MRAVCGGRVLHHGWCADVGARKYGCKTAVSPRKRSGVIARVSAAMRAALGRMGKP